MVYLGFWVGFPIQRVSLTRSGSWQVPGPKFDRLQRCSPFSFMLFKTFEMHAYARIGSAINSPHLAGVSRLGTLSPHSLKKSPASQK